MYGDTDKYGIYQLKDSLELRDFHFAGTAELLKRNLLSDDFKEIQPENSCFLWAYPELCSRAWGSGQTP